MSPVALLAALLTALAVAVAGQRPRRSWPERGLRRLDGCGPSSATRAARPDEGRGRGAWQYRLAGGLAGLGLWAAMGGITGAVLGVAVAVVAPRALTAFESRSRRDRRRRLEAAAPQVADLLAVCLAAGVTLSTAVRAVSEASPEPVAGLLHVAVGRLELGADPASTWTALAAEPALAPIARAALRSSESGAPLAEALLGVATELRQRHRATIEVAARSVGVRAVGPLGACFLPAFMLLGVVPLVASLLQRVLP